VKLAIVRQRYNPFGGAERIVSRVLPHLEKAGTQVTLITRKPAGWGARRVLEVDPFFVGNLWRDWSFARAARKAWLREGFDLVQSHERIPGCEVYRAGDGVHRRWLEIRRESGSTLERLAIFLNPYHRYVCRAEKAMFEHPRLRAVICISQMVKADVQRHFRVQPEKLHIIYNGVDLLHFSPDQSRALRGEARAKLGCSSRDTVFLFVGAGFARKGVGAAIAALAKTRNDALWLAIVGGDRHEQRFVQMARDAGVSGRVRFLGGQRDVRPFYAAADCVLLPSLYDPFGSTVLEGFAMGRPAIVSTGCGAAEVVEPGVNGWHCRPNDPDGLAKLMHAADEALRSPHMGEAARATAERFGLDAMARQMAELYASL
jgi:UDP-glucose:(heptosyl)LPS alpha-1,3-glucosyltransferase